MSLLINREAVQLLLEDESLSYREIARRVGCSDYAVRAIARKYSGDNRPMRLGGKSGKVRNTTQKGSPHKNLASPWITAAIAIGFAGLVLWGCFVAKASTGGIQT